MLTSRSPILDLLEPEAHEDHDSANPYAVNAENAVIQPDGSPRPDANSANPDAENAENAVITLPDRITAFRSFTASASTKSRHLDDQPDDPGVVVCYVCRSSDFWTGSGAVVCRRCHPPAPRAERLTFKRPTAGTANPVQIDAGSTPASTTTRTNSVPAGGAR